MSLAISIATAVVAVRIRDAIFVAAHNQLRAQTVEAVRTVAVAIDDLVEHVHGLLHGQGALLVGEERVHQLVALA